MAWRLDSGVVGGGLLLGEQGTPTYWVQLILFFFISVGPKTIGLNLEIEVVLQCSV